MQYINKIVYFFIFCILFSCKTQSVKSENKNYLSASSANKSIAFSSALHYKRQKELLIFMSKEFLEGCTTIEEKLNLAGHSSGINDSTGGPRSGSYVGGSANILTNQLLSGAKLPPLRNAKLSEKAYTLLPKILQPDGLLGWVQILRITEGGFEEIGESDLLKKFDNLSSSCKAHLYTMHVLSYQIVAFAKNMKDELENGCRRQGGVAGINEHNCLKPNTSDKGIYGNLPNIHPQTEASRFPYYEWPVCGGYKNYLTCEKPISKADRDNHKCSQCELRFTTNNGNYDLQTANSTRITCGNATAARNAMATMFINDCMHHPYKSHCTNFLDNSDSVDKCINDPMQKGCINYLTDMNAVLEYVTKSSHCDLVDSDTIAAKNSISQSGKSGLLDYITSNSQGNSLQGYVKGGYKGKLNLKLTKSFSKSLSTSSVLQIRKNGSKPYFVHRNGRIEFGPMAQLNCYEVTSESVCDETAFEASFDLHLGALLPFSLLTFGGSASTSKQQCSTEQKMSNTDWASLPYGGGLTFNQFRTICDQQSRVLMTETAAQEILNIIKNDKTREEFLALDTSNAGIYCHKRPEGKTDKDFLDFNTRIDKVYFARYSRGDESDSFTTTNDSENKNERQDDFSFVRFGVEFSKGSFDSKNFHVDLDNFDYEEFQNVISTKKFSSDSLAKLFNKYFTDLQAGKKLLKQASCRVIPFAPISIEYDRPLTCTRLNIKPQDGVLLDVEEEIKIKSIKLELDGLRMKLSMATNKPWLKEISTHFKKLGSFPQKFRSNGLSDSDLIALLEVFSKENNTPVGHCLNN